MSLDLPSIVIVSSLRVVVIVNVPVAPEYLGLPIFVNVIVIAPAASLVPSF